MSDFKKLKVWQKAHALSSRAFRVSQRIRGRDHATLRSQFARAADSIPANIVEGRGSASDREFARYIGYALSSAAEFEQHLGTALDRRVISRSTHLILLSELIEVRKMLYGLRRRLRGEGE